MMASQFAPGLPQGGMQHPMGPGGHPPGQPMGHPMHLHQGAAGPGMQHVSQAGPMMGGIQTGVGPGGPGTGNPGVTAMQHLNPNAQQIMAQQMQMNQMNPHLVQHQQQQMLRMRAMQQAAQMQAMQGQAQNPGQGMPFSQAGQPGFPAGHMQGVGAGQMAGAVQLPPHLIQQQQSLQQQRLQHQQLMMQQQQAQVAQQHALAQSQAQQAQQQQALANSHLQMQQVTSQSSHPGQGTPQSQASQQARQPQLQGAPQNNAAQDAQRSPAQPPNAAQNTSQPSQQPSGQPQTQPTQPQQQNAGQQNPQQAQQGQQGQPQTPQNQQQMTPQQRMMQQQQQKQAENQQLNQQQLFQRQQMQAMAQKQAALRPSGGILLRLYSFADHISRFVAGENRDEQHWREFVAMFFAPDSSLRHIVSDGSKTKQWEVFYPSIARYFHVHYDGIDQIQILIESPTENPLTQPQHIYVEAAKAKFIYNFKNGTMLVNSGRLWAIYQGDKISTLQFEIQENKQFVAREEVSTAVKEGAANSTKSPKMSKKNQRNQVAQNDPKSLSDMILDQVPSAPITSYGITKSVQTFFEVNETMSLMTELMKHNSTHPGMTPQQSLSALAHEYQAAQQGQQTGGQPPQNLQHTPQQPNINLPQNGQVNPMMQGGVAPQRTASATGMQMQPNMPMSSPALHNSLIPGMPGVNGGGINLNAATIQGGHTPSPAAAHMQAPAMAHQLSAQGSIGGSSAASVSASPNMAGKRRRPSGVKAEDELEANGVQAKVKASPRNTGQNKRMKGS